MAWSKMGKQVWVGGAGCGVWLRAGVLGEECEVGVWAEMWVQSTSLLALCSYSQE